MITPKQIKVEGITIKELMRLAGYAQHTKGYGYIRYFEEFDGIDIEKYRFHIYEKSDYLLEIHTDKLKKKGNKKFHIASTFTTAPEKARIKKLMPQKLKEARKFKNESLTREQYLKAMEDLESPIFKKIKTWLFMK